MPRNFDRRVEAVAPVEDASLHPRLRSLLETCLTDNRQAWDLAPDGSYVQRHPDGDPERSAQAIFLQTCWGLDPRDDDRSRSREDASITQSRLR
jgi:polyphosphate kinase